MSKQEQNITANCDPTPELLRRVEDEYRAYRAKNPGQNPTRSDLNKIIRTSFTRLCKAARIVEDKLDSIETKLGTMPSIPEDLRLLQQQFLKDLWSRTQEIGNSELKACRRAAELQEDKHRREMEQTVEILEVVEGEGEEARKECDDAAAENAGLRASLLALDASLAASEARVEELRSIIALLGRDPFDVPGAKPNEEILPSGDDAALSARRVDACETSDLPGMTFPELDEGHLSE